MGENLKQVPADWKKVLDEEAISRATSRICYEILEKGRENEKLAVVGIRTAGEFLARRIKKRLEEIGGVEVAFGVIDITLYRDDLYDTSNSPTLKGTDLPFAISGTRIILVDDVLFTGRTIRAALDAIVDFGRPARVELATLVDRGHRELPIRSDYVGKNLPTNIKESVKVRFREMGYEDGVYLMANNKGKK